MEDTKVESQLKVNLNKESISGRYLGRESIKYELKQGILGWPLFAVPNSYIAMFDVIELLIGETFTK